MNPRLYSASHVRRRWTRASRLAFGIAAAGMSLALFAAFARHVSELDFKPLAALGLPVLLVLFGFASLLFLRGRSLAKGSAQVRSLYAAEKAMQAAVWHLSGIMLAIVLYAVLMRAGIAGGPWLLLFLVPYAFMQVGLLSFLRAVWLIAPQFFRPVGAFELRRRVEQ